MTDNYPGPEDWDTYMWVVAHPDDLEFSSAGTVKKLVNAGKKCILVQVTSGDRGTGDRSFTRESLMATREREETEAVRRLGMAELVFLHEGDGQAEGNNCVVGEVGPGFPAFCARKGGGHGVPLVSWQPTRAGARRS